MPRKKQPYCPKRARTKYAMPMWVDAFLRKTMPLSAAEIGIWHLLAYAMWSNVDLRLKDKDDQLARIARMTKRAWLAGPRELMEEFFEIEGGYWTNDRMQLEAKKTEDFLLSQHRRKVGNLDEKNANPVTLIEDKAADTSMSKSLKENKQGLTVDASTVEPAEQPYQETKSISSSKASSFSELVDGSGLPKALHPLLFRLGIRFENGRLISVDGTRSAETWLEATGLPNSEAIEVMHAVVGSRGTADGINGLTYFNQAIERRKEKQKGTSFIPLVGKINGQSNTNAATRAFLEDE